MQDAKEEVRARLDIEDVIGEYVQLKRAGRNYKGLSPFTQERTPSFVVSPDKQIWHCFSTSKGGDVFSFIMEVEGVDFKGALEVLARKAGVDLDQYKTAKDGELSHKRKRAREAHTLAARFYQQTLIRDKQALEYVKSRGFNRQVIGDFLLGYAPSDGKLLVAALRRKGFSQTELRDAGLLNQYGGDLFRGRLVVPLMDTTGQVIGFTGRVLVDDGNGPKYLNTPETLLYNKTRHVFGLSQAKEAIRKQDFSVIVEGNLDVVSSHQVDVKNVVATAGTALTEAQLRALSRLSPNVRLSFDGDKAGLAAAERAIPIAQHVGVELSMITLPDGVKDPDELIQKDPELWRSALDNHKPAIDWLLEQYKTREDLSTAAGKRAYTTAGLGLVKSISDPVTREHYMQLIAKTIDTTLKSLEDKIATIDTETKRLKQTNVVSGEVKKEPASAKQQDIFLALLLFTPEARELVAPRDVALTGDHRQDIVKQIRDNLQPETDYAKILVLRAEELYSHWSVEERTKEAARILRMITKEHKKTKRDELIDELRKAEASDDDRRAGELRSELNNLIKEINNG